jgi:hypothetical protein
MAGKAGPVPGSSPSIFSSIPYSDSFYEGYLTVDKFFRDNIRWVNSTMGGKFFWKTLEWLKTTSGAKSWLIQLPEAINKVTLRYKDSTATPALYLIKFNHWIKPLHIVTPCAKTWLPFVDVGAKLPAIFTPVKDRRQYVVIDKTSGLDDQTRPFAFSLDLAKWEQWLDKCEALAQWVLSVCQCEAVCRKLNNEPARWSIVASIVSPLISAKTLYTEGSFLYKTIRRDQYQRMDNGKKTVTANIAKQEIYGSALKIALSIICLSLDAFNKFASKGDKPVWLETALFWTSIAPTFVAPAAHYYMPELVVRPLQASVGIK